MLTPYDETELRLIYTVLVLLTACLTLAVSSWADLRRIGRGGWWSFPHRLYRRARICTVCTFALALAWALAWSVAP